MSIAIRQGDPWKMASFGIYGVTLISVFVFATLYHGSNDHTKAFFSKLDHLSIYLLIAGTYTPFALVSLRKSVGWPLFGIIWTLAILGIVLNLVPKQGNRVLPVIIFVVMGWLMLAVIKSLMLVLPMTGVYGLLLGGLFYTSGVVFYLLDGKFSYFHGIWHIFVLLGSFSHYFAILYFVA